MGQGYVGLPVAMAAVDAKFDVVGYDLDETRVDSLLSGQSFVDDVPDERLQAALATGRYVATCDPSALKDFDIAVISVPTPLRDGNPDLTYIERAAHVLAPYVREGCCVILESTTYPGTTEELVQPILEEASGMTAEKHFFLGYSPERIDPGNQVWTFERTPKIVAGVGPRSLQAVTSFFDRLVERTVPVRSVRVAELTKLLENTFRHVNIALVNELAMFAHDLNIDIWEAIEAASTKPFGFMKFTPGPGVGGHCLPIDPSYLSWRVRRSLGESFRFVELADDINDHMPNYVVRRIVVALNERGLAVKGRRILLLGLAYKRNTADAREAPSREIARQLIALGADVVAADPHVEESGFSPRLPIVDLTAAELAAADLAVLVTDHEAFDLDLILEHARYVFDTRNCLPDGANVERL